MKLGDKLYNLKTTDQDRCREFMVLTQAGERTAIFCLAQHEFKLDLALDSFFANPERYFRGPRTAAPAERARLVALFDRFSDPEDPSRIGVSGFFLLMHKMFPDSVDVLKSLQAFWKFRVQTRARISREEFLTGMAEMGCSTLDELREALACVDKELEDPVVLRDFYRYTFHSARRPGEKNLDVSVAVSNWKVVLENRFRLLPQWCDFLTERHRKSISKGRFPCCAQLLNLLSTELFRSLENTWKRLSLLF